MVLLASLDDRVVFIVQLHHEVLVPPCYKWKQEIVRLFYLTAIVLKTIHGSDNLQAIKKKDQDQARYAGVGRA